MVSNIKRDITIKNIVNFFDNETYCANFNVNYGVSLSKNLLNHFYNDYKIDFKKEQTHINGGSFCELSENSIFTEYYNVNKIQFEYFYSKKRI